MITEERPRPDLAAHRAIVEAHRRDSYYDADAELELNRKIDEILAGFASPEEKMISLIALSKLNTADRDNSIHSEPGTDTTLVTKVIEQRIHAFTSQAYTSDPEFSENPLLRNRTPLFTEKTLWALAFSPLMDQMLTDPQLCPAGLSDSTGRDLVALAVVADAVRSVSKECQVQPSVDIAVISVTHKTRSRALTQIGNARHMVNVASTVTHYRRYDPVKTPNSTTGLITAAEPKPFVDAEANLRGYLDTLKKKKGKTGVHRRRLDHRNTGVATEESEPDF